MTFPVLDVEGRTGEIYGRLMGKPDPRSAPPKHLYLPGPHRGVWNIAAFAETDELIVTESIIDALTLWCAGFRHVTAAYGTDGWTPEHQQAIQEHGIRRVLIAFDADAAGDNGAKNLAAELATIGVESYRVELPRGSDVNEVAVGAKLPGETLGKFLRKAAWMDSLAKPAPRQASARPQAEPVVPAAVPEPSAPEPEPSAPVPEPVVVEPEPPRPAAVVEPGLDSPAHTVEPVEPESVAPAEDDEPAGDGAVVGRELVIELGTRRWRVRGLEKVTSFDVLRVNLLVTRTDRPRLAENVAGRVPRRHPGPVLRPGQVGVRRCSRPRTPLRAGGRQGRPGAGAAGVRGEGRGSHRGRAGTRQARGPADQRAARSGARTAAGPAPGRSGSSMISAGSGWSAR